jgi:hypothetical protein
MTQSLPCTNRSYSCFFMVSSVLIMISALSPLRRFGSNPRSSAASPVAGAPVQQRYSSAPHRDGDKREQVLTVLQRAFRLFIQPMVLPGLFLRQESLQALGLFGLRLLTVFKGLQLNVLALSFAASQICVASDPCRTPASPAVGASSP